MFPRAKTVQRAPTPKTQKPSCAQEARALAQVAKRQLALHSYRRNVNLTHNNVCWQSHLLPEQYLMMFGTMQKLHNAAVDFMIATERAFEQWPFV